MSARKKKIVKKKVVKKKKPKIEHLETMFKIKGQIDPNKLKSDFKRHKDKTMIFESTPVVNVIIETNDVTLKNDLLKHTELTEQ